MAHRLIVAVGLALGLAVVSAGGVLADGGPHGGYDKLMDGTVGATDKCAACHRPHQGLSQGFLLKKQTQYELCVTCHDGSVSKLDVLDGVKLGTTVSPRVPGQTGTTLNGGGFEYVNGAAITSKHNVKTSLSDPGESQPWGYLARPGEKSGTLSQPLTCTSCHNPHGSANYRMFRESINSYKVSVLAFYGGAFTANEGARGLETGAPADKYTAEYYGSAGLLASGGYRPDVNVTNAGDPNLNGFALLCGACHNTYPSSSAKTIPTNDPWGLGTGTAKYRHRIEVPYDQWQSPKYGGSVPNNPETSPYDPGSGALPALRLASNTTDTNKIVTCLTCHRAHGTATQMSGWALSSALGGSSPDEISPAQTADSKSMLLFTDNRAMCEACHQW